MSTELITPSRCGEILLQIARSTISTALGHPLLVDEDNPWLQDQRACFVTLTQQGQLRGCIGTLEARRSLLTDIKENALAASFKDPRFTPLTVTDLIYTQIEVSLLSPMQPMQFGSETQALTQLQPGIDGVVLEFCHYRSTFLPQVWEQLPTASEFIAHLKHKAGLPADFWAESMKLSRYTVSKWKEPDILPDIIISKARRS